VEGVIWSGKVLLSVWSGVLVSLMMALVEEVGVSAVGDGRCCVIGCAGGVYGLSGKHGVCGEEAKGVVGGSGKFVDGDVCVTYPYAWDVGCEEVQA
jgi:hypothetical protein